MSENNEEMINEEVEEIKTETLESASDDYDCCWHEGIFLYHTAFVVAEFK